jgi:GTPase SAR1 family protein
VYDVTALESYNAIPGWLEELRDAVGVHKSSSGVAGVGGVGVAERRVCKKCDSEETASKSGETNQKVDPGWYKRNNIIIALVGNKRDLTLSTNNTGGGIRGEDLDLPVGSKGVPKRQVPTSTAEEYAAKEGMLFFETSAKLDDDEGVNNLFDEVIFWCNYKNEREGNGGRREGRKLEKKVELVMPEGAGGCC